MKKITILTATAITAALFLSVASAREVTLSGSGIQTAPKTFGITVDVYSASLKGVANYTNSCGPGEDFYGTLVYESGGGGSCSGNADMIKATTPAGQSIDIYNKAALVAASIIVPACSGTLYISKSGALTYTSGGICTTTKPTSSTSKY